MGQGWGPKPGREPMGEKRGHGKGAGEKRDRGQGNWGNRGHALKSKDPPPNC